MDQLLGREGEGLKRGLVLPVFGAMICLIALGAFTSPGAHAAKPKLADLKLRSGSASLASGVLTGSITVQNSGKKRAAASKAAITWKGPGKSSPIGELSTPSLGPGRSATTRFRITLPASPAPGTYTVTACADATSKVREVRESNKMCIRDSGWAVHTHLAEVREELSASRIEHGCSTIQYADRVGLLEHEVIAGHCIWCSEKDIGLMASRDVAVAHNPVANMILASGVCPVPRFLREGVRVGIGTDGAASNDSQDMFGAVKTAGLIQKLHTLDAAAMTATEVMDMATIGGARALGLDGEIGSLEVGKRADVVLLDGNTPELAVQHDPFQQLVYATTSRSVSDVWVDGVKRVEGGSVIGTDVVELAREAREASIDLAERAGLAGESVHCGKLEFEEE